MELLDRLRGGLIVSCQAPAGSPLDNPAVIAAMAAAAERAGAVAVRVNGPENVRATRAAVRIPILGIYKRRRPDYEVYITPSFEDARDVREAGADLVALDATARRRPGGVAAAELIARVSRELACPVMADIATCAEGVAAAKAGAALVATTLCGYTRETSGHLLPALDLVVELARTVTAPVVCEGGVASPEQLAEAFRRGAFAVVVGTAITGIEAQVHRFGKALPGST